MTGESLMGPAEPAGQGSPHDIFREGGANQPADAGFGKSDMTSISTPATPERSTTDTNTISGVFTNTIQIQKKNTVRAIRVSELQWKLFLRKAHELGYSANELLNQFINSIVAQAPDFPSKAHLTFNIAIAKSESKPTINVGEYVTLRQVEDLLAQARKLRDRAEKERDRGLTLTFTRERAKSLEEGLLKALKSLKSLDPGKLQEVETALKILKGIREGSA